MTPPLMPSNAAGQEHGDTAALGPWFHNLHLPDGSQTAPDHPLGDFPARKWRQVAPHVPADLTGWRVLDVGCNAGFYSFELARRGADVLGIDREPHFLRQAEWGAGVYGLKQRVRFERMHVYDVSRLPERFDLVLFMGVFYHLRYPQLALDLLASRTGRLFVFQTLTMPGNATCAVEPDGPIEERERFHERGWPKMAFVEHSFAGDPTNWWVPNHAACEALLRSAGMRITRRPGHEIYVCEPVGGLPPDSSELLSAAAAGQGIAAGEWR
jgi:tRNA (mo5U34)-methyltransferase